MILKKNLMKKVFCSLIAIAFLSVAVSCNKEKVKQSSASAIKGNWKFISISAKTQSIVSYKDPDDGANYMTVTKSDYTSTDNGGIVSFSPSTMTGTEVTYSINATAYTESYVDGQLVDTDSFPFTFTYPPTNSTSAYKIIGQDSIYSAGQTLVGGQGSSGSTTPSGLKFTIAGNTLTMTGNFLKDTVINYAGEILNQHETGVASLILQKQ